LVLKNPKRFGSALPPRKGLNVFNLLAYAPALTNIEN